MSVVEIASYFPEMISETILDMQNRLLEIRMRAGQKTQLICLGEERFVGDALSVTELRKIALRMMNHSYYACEDELARGFFTMKNGCRVGVGGSYSPNENLRSLSAIGSLCIRIARAIPGCAESIVKMICDEGYLRATLILSRPGLGKTTMLRDTARMLSELGILTGIADERHEIAACCDGVPTLDVGMRTDVLDGLPKAIAIEHLIRSMSPQVIVTDEIGNEHDYKAILEAARMGIPIIASAHASSFDEFEAGGMRKLLLDGVFQLAVLLGSKPGYIIDVRRYGKGWPLGQ